jgi:glycosyltransferase involved in cell wall biosynthesis
MSESQSYDPSDASRAITVAIPTYNGAKRLPLVLDRLKTQVVPAGLRWEVLIVDNNSQDNTAAVVQQYQRNWLPEVPLRYCFEPRQGAAFARIKAVQAATGKLVGFLDDDNFPQENWVAEAVDFSDRFPQAGAFSGRILGSYEVPPPAGFENIQHFLAIRDHGSKVTSFKAEHLRLPPAASLVVRRQAWLDSVPLEPTLTGKLPHLFIQGEDYEPLIYLSKKGWQILYDPDLVTHHQIPKQRFEKDYLLMLGKGCGLATYKLRSLGATPQEALNLWVRTLGANLRNLILHWLKYRQRIHQELDAGVFWAFYWGSFLSPFVQLKQKQTSKS